ncbi:MAG: amidohydrolase [Chloroflexi bacterium]|nr:amidohydrolase [Chloroflexota bacterium]
MAEADTIILGGAVVTVTGGTAEAVAVEGEEIVAVGSEAKVLERRGRGTEVVDLKGAALLPGLIEPHTHPEGAAQCYSWMDVSGFTHKSVDGVETALREATARAAPGEWVFAFGLDAMLTTNLGTWDRHRLDGIAPENPMVVMIQSQHTVFVNSAALQAAGVDKDTPDPPGGGRILRDAKGEPTGVVMEQPATAMFIRYSTLDSESWTTLLQEQYERYRAAGITTIGVAGMFVPRTMLPSFETPSEDGVRAVAYLHENVGDKYAGDDVQGVKLWYDGSPYSGTMLLDEPYLESPLNCETLGIAPGSRGHANIEAREMIEALEKYRDRGWQVLAHAQGDRGTREVLDAYERVLAGQEGSDHRWRIEHCALISDADIVRAAEIGVALGFHANHVYYYGPELRDSIIGPERAELLMPMGSAVRSGHRISMHTDSPMYPPDPLKLMRTAVTRKTRSGEQIAPNEAISIEEALRAVTIDAAWQLFREDRIGSIKVGSTPTSRCWRAIRWRFQQMSWIRSRCSRRGWAEDPLAGGDHRC